MLSKCRINKKKIPPSLRSSQYKTRKQLDTEEIKKSMIFKKKTHNSINLIYLPHLLALISLCLWSGLVSQDNC